MTPLVLDPHLGFARLAAALEADGWRRVDQAAAPLVPGEPEHARFERQQGEGSRLESLQYTFNPVCRLRVLEPGGTLGGLPESVRTVGPVEVAVWLGSDDDREVLRGVLGALLLREPDLAPRVAPLVSHRAPAVAAAAGQAMEVLSGVRSRPGPGEGDPTSAARARAEARVAVDLLVEQLRPLLRALGQDPDGRLARELEPRPGDFGAVFVADAADGARAAYRDVWARGPRVRSVGADWTLRVRVAPEGMLRTENELSFHFPGGYRGIAHLLDPHRVWVRWSYLRPGADAGQSYDGLVWIDDHWSWFPKPYRVLRPLVEAHPD